MGRAALALLAEGFVPSALPKQDKGLCKIPVLLSERQSKALKGEGETKTLPGPPSGMPGFGIWAQNPSSG